jgi:hypothetical protein
VLDFPDHLVQLLDHRDLWFSPALPALETLLLS